MKIEDNALFTNYVFKSIPLAFDESMSYYETLCALMQAVKDNRVMIEQIARFNEITYADPLEWNITSQYPRYQIVMDNLGNAYLSTQPVPSGIELTNKDYWIKVFNYDVQLQGIKDEIEQNKDYINVLSLGVDNTGTSDVSTLIQQAINNNPMKTLFFPAGTYLWNNKVVIGSANASCVNLKFDRNALIQANVSLDSFLDVGGVNTGQYRRYTPGAIVTIEGGIWNCSNVDKGITITSRRPETHILHTNLIQVSHYGLYLLADPDRNYNSGDTFVEDCFIGGDKISDNTGIYATSKDNIFNNIFISGCLKGIDFTNSAGNFVTYCHLIASYESDNMYENSIGVINGNTRINYFTNLYNDTMRIGIDNRGGNVILTNYYCYYWWQKFTNPVIAIQSSGSSSSLTVSNGYIQFKNTTTNGNYVLYLTSGVQGTFERGSFKIDEVNVTDRKVPVGTIDFYDDVTINRNAINKYIVEQNATTMTQNTWYRIGTISSSTGIHNFTYQHGNELTCDVCLLMSGSPSATSKFLKRANTTNNYQLGIGAQYSYNNANYRDLYIRCTSGSAGKFNPNFMQVGNTWSWANPFIITQNPVADTTTTITNILNLY